MHRSLSHYTQYPIRRLFNIKQKNQESINRKPVGLWISDDSNYGWKEWCEAEEFALERLKFKYEITLVEDANILYINNPYEIDQFVDIFKMPEPDFLREIHEKTKVRMAKLLHRIEEEPIYSIDWEMVAEEYSGIIISPHQNISIFEPKHSWYYGWDCASGCIWDTDAINELNLCDPVHLEDPSSDVPSGGVESNAINDRICV